MADELRVVQIRKNGIRVPEGRASDIVDSQILQFPPMAARGSPIGITVQETVVLMSVVTVRYSTARLSS